MCVLLLLLGNRIYSKKLFISLFKDGYQIYPINIQIACLLLYFVQY